MNLDTNPQTTELKTSPMAELLLLPTSKVIDCVEQIVLDLYVYVMFRRKSNNNATVQTE